MHSGFRRRKEQNSTENGKNKRKQSIELNSFTLVHINVSIQSFRTETGISKENTEKKNTEKEKLIFDLAHIDKYISNAWNMKYGY